MVSLKDTMNPAASRSTEGKNVVAVCCYLPLWVRGIPMQTLAPRTAVHP